eukprot:TRINITY_DN11233_c0_g1_i2.p1 TRINITY_DN11233_c0_g1~~TRINITY_DN11233_c0_g1_i2.p1  ORF type:complete len:580 (-),score=115.70 TRINITY_DN11233_c0_g1_i2:453-2192(-)
MPTTAAVSDSGLHPVGYGCGGADQLRNALIPGTVQWSILDIHIGEGALRRRKTLFIHVNSEGCPALQRSKANEYSAHVKGMIASDASAGFHQSLTVTSADELTSDHILEQVGKYMVSDGADYSVEWLIGEYERKIFEDRKRQRQEAEAAAEKDTKTVTRPGMRSKRRFTEGRDALRAVSEPRGPWNWLFGRFGEDADSFELIAGGDGSIYEMEEYMAENPAEVLFGVLRMGFGIGRFRRTKYVFVRFIGSASSAVQRGIASQAHPVARKQFDPYCSISIDMEVSDSEEFSEEEVVKRVNRLTTVDYDGLAHDSATRVDFTVEAFREALEEEKCEAAEAEASAAFSSAGKEPHEFPGVQEIVRLVHSDSPTNWALFQAGTEWLGKGSAPPPVILRTDMLMPGRKGLKVTPTGGYKAAEDRRLSVEPGSEPPRIATLIEEAPLIEEGDEEAEEMKSCDSASAAAALGAVSAVATGPGASVEPAETAYTPGAQITRIFTAPASVVAGGDDTTSMVWQVQFSHWTDCSPEQQEILRQARREGKTQVTFSHGRFDYVVDFTRMVQRNVASGRERNLRECKLSGS